MSDALSAYYDLNPVGVISANRWNLYDPEVNAQFRAQGVYTQLIDWQATGDTGAVYTTEFELLEGDVDSNPIPMTSNYIDAHGVDSRARTFTVLRYGDKVQLHKSSNYFNMWRMGGTRDWRPLLRGLLGWNVVTKYETLARNVWFKGSKSYWTYANGKSSWADLTTSDTFQLDKVNEWHLRLGYTGSPVIPGDQGAAKVAIVPPGAIYDFFSTLANASKNEASMWRDAHTYAGHLLNYELGSFKDVRFQQAPSSKFGLNSNVLYNCGTITAQHLVVTPINMGDGSPDPTASLVDGIWAVGQKDAAHFLPLESVSDLALNDFVTIHVKRTNAYGVTGGVDPFDGKTITRRIVAIDSGAHTISLDRPVMFNYSTPMPQGDGSNAYAYVTKAINIGFALVLGSRGGVKGLMHKPIEFYEPRPVDDFDSVWRFSWDSIIGHNIAEPNLFELTFFAVSIPKPGGIG